jgi:hypothetical protein
LAGGSFQRAVHGHNRVVLGFGLSLKNAQVGLKIFHSLKRRQGHITAALDKRPQSKESGPSGSNRRFRFSIEDKQK